MSDVNKALVSLVALLENQKKPFRANLRNLADSAGVSSTATRKLFQLYSDVLSTRACSRRVGDWCVAEIEGTEVQFNPIVDLFATMVFKVSGDDEGKPPVMATAKAANWPNRHSVGTKTNVKVKVPNPNIEDEYDDDEEETETETNQQ